MEEARDLQTTTIPGHLAVGVGSVSMVWATHCITYTWKNQILANSGYICRGGHEGLNGEIVQGEEREQSGDFGRAGDYISLRPRSRRHTVNA